MAHVRSTSTAIISAVLVVAALAAPASAAGTKHGTCASFGAAFAEWAHSEAGAVGAGVSALAHVGPGTVATVIADEKLALCEGR